MEFRCDGEKEKFTSPRALDKQQGNGFHKLTKRLGHQENPAIALKLRDSISYRVHVLTQL